MPNHSERPNAMKTNTSPTCAFMNRRQFIRATLASAFAAAATGCTIELPSAGEEFKGIYILYTSDIHCGVDEGFGLASLRQVRDSLEARGYRTLLVDDGDQVQGEPLGMLTKGESIIELMNKLGYDVAIPGNHEFDYGMERFFELVEMADFPYISCNFTKNDELVFDPYKIVEIAEKRIAFVGVTTPESLVKGTPRFFQNDEGEYIYGFGQDKTGKALYAAVQEAIDAARAEGVDYVYVMAHLGLEASAEPWTYADVIENTTGIDVMFDGHSHDTEQVVMKDKDGKKVARSACGTKLNCIGYSFIDPDGEIEDTGIWTWTNDIPAVELLGVENDIVEAVEAEKAELTDITDEVVAKSAVNLTICDPEALDSSGNPIRIIRCAETNLGDFCADAIRVQTGADVAVMNSGGIRTDINKGDITYGDVLALYPYANDLCVIEATGQTILDALEWGASELPEEKGAFLQVSGLSYTVDTSIPSGCETNDEGQCIGISGKRRVRDVQVDGKDIDPSATYALGGTHYTLLERGGGYLCFDECPAEQTSIKVDSQALIDYILDDLGGEVGAEYADPYGQGRITVVG